MNITERQRNGDWMALNGHWMVNECTCHSVDWMVTERWLNGAWQFSRNGGVSSCEIHFNQNNFVWQRPNHHTLYILKKKLGVISSKVCVLLTYRDDINSTGNMLRNSVILCHRRIQYPAFSFFYSHWRLQINNEFFFSRISIRNCILSLLCKT